MLFPFDSANQHGTELSGQNLNDDRIIKNEFADALKNDSIKNSSVNGALMRMSVGETVCTYKRVKSKRKKAKSVKLSLPAIEKLYIPFPTLRR